MNDLHGALGGMDSLPRNKPEPNEPMFHTGWQARVLAMVRAMRAAGAFNIDTSATREVVPPEVYITSSYYRKWFLGLEDMLLAKGYIPPAEVAAAQEAAAPKSPPKAGARQGGRIMVHAADSGARRDTGSLTSPAIGSAPKTSTRRRTRACRVMCAAMSWVWSGSTSARIMQYPDTASWRWLAQWLIYTVVFGSAELGFFDADPAFKVSVDAFRAG